MSENTVIDYLDNVKLIPISSDLRLRSKKEILDRMLIDYTIASIATYAFCSSYELIKTFLSNLDKKYEISKIIKGKDRELIINIFNKRISKENLENITYRFESSSVCMWMLGFTDDINYNKKCSVKSINELLLSNNNYNELLFKSNIRTNSEVINYYSKIAKFVYSNSILNKTVSRIVDMQDVMFKYIILYNFNKYGLKVIYSSNTLKFDFVLTDGILFDKAGINTKEILALSGTNSGVRIIFCKLDKGIRIQDDMKRFMDMGFEINNVSYMNSLYLEKRIVKVNMTKGSLNVNSYYLTINDNIIRIDSKVTKVSIDNDLIYSIKVFE